MRCLEKDPDARFPDAQALLVAFETCNVAGSWTQSAAALWWDEWSESHLEDLSSSIGSSSGSPSGWSIDLQ